MLMASTGKGDPLAHPRLTVIGTFRPVARDDPHEARVRRRFLARHPKAELYAGSPISRSGGSALFPAHLNAGFARAADLKAADVMTDLAGAENLIESRGGRDRAHERGPCRRRAALRDQASWRGRRSLAPYRP